jgi:uncharacterized protein DUF4328
MRWVAAPPPGAYQPRRHRGTGQPERYLGPPAYPVPPRWGFPNLTWREPTNVPGTASSLTAPFDHARVRARNVITVLWFLAGLATVASAAELWRYALLVISRDSALNSRVVAMSDTLEIVSSLLTVVFGLLALTWVLWWLLVIRYAAAEESGCALPRSSRQVLIGVLVPGINLALAGSVLAELEHAVLRRPRDRRPRPSRLVLSWWAAWMLNELLMVVAIVWRSREGIQAQADAVLLSGVLDASAALLAGLTAVVVYRLTSLISPVPVHRMRLRGISAVRGAPPPRLRPSRPAGAAR